MSAEMTNNEMLRIIDEYLDKIVKEINQNGGFVQNHDKIGVTGLFRGEPESTLAAAHKIHEKIKTYNQSRFENGESQIKIGIVLSHSKVMSEGAAAITKHAIMLKTLELIAGELGMGILADGWLLDEIKDREKYWYRYLGKIISAEFGEPIDIYEFYELDDKKHVKKYTADRFETGVRLFYASEYYEARKYFDDVLTLLPEDMASKIYLEKCDLCIGGQSSSATSCAVSFFPVP